MFHLHRAERTDVLADALAQLLAIPLPDPMTTEIVSVPAPGVERWLQQRLATRLGTSRGRDGVAANLDFTSPALLTDQILQSAERFVDGEGARVPAAQRWRPAAMTWPVLRVLDDLIDDPRLAVLARHVGADASAEDHRRGRRYATARQIADLFDSYGRQRPAMLAAWAAGTDTDGVGAPVPADLAWQPDVWRAVRREIGHPHPAERLAEHCAALREHPNATDLPERLSVFGPTRVTESLLAVLVAVSAHRDVHLFVPHPSPALWQILAPIAAVGTADGRRRADNPPPPLAHPLLAGLSHDVQELQRRVAPIVDHDVHHPLPGAADHDGVLAALQAGLRDDMPAPALRDADTSVEVHACHGAERQVEVLRDRLLHLFAADPTLQPRDVLIMCPDVEVFAPLVRGAFGQPGLGHPAFELRVRLADRGLRHTNSVLDVIAAVVELAAGRVTAGAVVDLLGRDPVRRRFDLTDDDLEVIREWLVGSNIRWAIDDAQRARFGLAGFRQGTFETGIDRILLGAVAEETDNEWLDTALPLGGVESTEIDLAGRFAEFVDRLSTTLNALTGTQSADAWTQVITDAVDALVRTEADSEWQRAQALRAVAGAFDDGAVDAGGSDAPPVDLRLGDIRDLIAGLVSAAPTRANFRTGELTVCSMVPMRSVPHRVIVLLGVDGDAFPRALRHDGDDVLARAPLLGERNPRDEDRQLFLDAICAAEEHVLVFYSGADPVSGQRIPPAVVVSELVDAVSAITGVPDGCVRRHTLHAFDADNFTPGAIPGVAGPFSYDIALLAGARASGTTPDRRPLIADIRLDPPAPDDIELASLIGFLTNPIEGFVRQRLGARIPDEELPHADQLDVALAPLDRWAIGDRFLSRMLAGTDLTACQAAERRRGTLPPYAFGTRELQDISADVASVFAAAESARMGAPATVDVVVPLPDGRRLYGTVGDVYAGTVVTASYSKLRAKQRLTAWIRLLAVAADRQAAGRGDDIHAAAVIARRPTRSGGVARSLLAVPDNPLDVLVSLIGLRDLGFRRVLPLPLDPAADFADHHRRSGRADRAVPAARRAFDGDFGAGRDRYLRMVFGGDVTRPVDFDVLLAEPIPPDDDWSGPTLPTDADGALFGALARLVWEPLLDHETMT
ncbi:exodeoxyribonuclease V subunit gamma [Gordonia sp. HNM0687]|uniref:RecBCD enzyme subunit RecC n=1 Tax=Gordonia mangrovi TaxID=2665643 RepID=A0A6L7GWW0_9ACTN|nr:exodeoxyribonuclease V subunit gamma [Gordonia mangrovi]MXP24083.1 exodeoxyribonuclease V subunit gamma [Gordonia mangrovi]UVF78112.1 exodeoxyribonuclease V subunit gamma [Gordonia mangrovi]